MPITVNLEASDLRAIVRALESELRFVEWLIHRTVQDQRSRSAAELSIEVSDLRRLCDRLKQGVLVASSRGRKKLRAVS